MVNRGLVLLLLLPPSLWSPPPAAVVPSVMTPLLPPPPPAALPAVDFLEADDPLRDMKAGSGIVEGWMNGKCAVYGRCAGGEGT